jgi:hypothetical protein
MGDLTLGEPFGLDPAAIKGIDWKLSLSRMLHDVRSDFIYAPHLSYIYRFAGDQLIENLKAALKAGKFTPGVPVTIEVPKSFRFRVAVPSKRPGPSFSRPGSILLPQDRILYQALSDRAAPVIDAKTDHNRSFSHRLAAKDSPNMFLSTRTCWHSFQQALAQYSKGSGNYVVKIDIANCFGSINQHTLINLLIDSGYPKSLATRLEAMLTHFTGERSSRGILQGLFPSDLLGNFYMTPLDRFFEDYGIASVRYVDDIYVYIDRISDAERIVRSFVPFLRGYDLILNEYKCAVLPKVALVTEEPDLDQLFADAVSEISSQTYEDIGTSYGFQAEWSDEPDQTPDPTAIKLKATQLLFDSIATFQGKEENIERFCLPLFALADSDHAVSHVLEVFKKRPSMAQIYASYLAKFTSQAIVRVFLQEMLNDDQLCDWQKIWILACLLQHQGSDNVLVKAAAKILNNTAHHDTLRAVAAIYVGYNGDLSRRKDLSMMYPNVSGYVQSAIYYSTRRWPGVERGNAKAKWGSHGPLNSLITAAFSNPEK